MMSTVLELVSKEFSREKCIHIYKDNHNGTYSLTYTFAVGDKNKTILDVIYKYLSDYPTARRTLTVLPVTQFSRDLNGEIKITVDPEESSDYCFNYEDDECCCCCGDIETKDEPMTVGRDYPADGKYRFSAGNLSDQAADMIRTLHRFRALVNPVFAWVTNSVKSALVSKAPENKPFTKDYKREGGRDTRGNKLMDFGHFSGDDLPYLYGGGWGDTIKKGIFTGQLLASITYKWDDSRNIEKSRGGSNA